MIRTALTDPLVLQRLIATPFLVLGAWCLFFPNMVADLALTTDFRSEGMTTSVLMGCFGAQAVLAGTFATFSRFTRTTFLAYGLLLLPFFWFNYYFVFEVPVFTPLMLLDFAANATMLGLSILGWKFSSS
jgi:hypothetical protein